MAISWLTALRAVPWGTILSQAPTVVDAANRLLSQSKRKPPQPGSPDGFETLKERIAALEEHDQADAAVVKQLADQLAELSRLSQVMAVRLRMVLLLGTMAILASMVAIALAIFA
jgi:uncharacterized coiled-coil protein SlyX